MQNCLRLFLYPSEFILITNFICKCKLQGKRVFIHSSLISCALWCKLVFATYIKTIYCELRQQVTSVIKSSWMIILKAWFIYKTWNYYELDLTRKLTCKSIWFFYSKDVSGIFRYEIIIRICPCRNSFKTRLIGVKSA